MPKAVEQKLKREAKQRGFSEEHADRFVYGTMRKMGWKPHRELTDALAMVSGDRKAKKKLY